MRHRHPALTLSLACLGLLVAALLPHWAHALAPVGGVAPGQVICTALGMQTLGAEGTTADEGSSPVVAMSGACTLCCGHLPALGMPPLSPVSALTTSLAASVPPLFLAAPRTLFAWAQAQPRGPPAAA